jgi:hypothetical protein
MRKINLKLNVWRLLSNLRPGHTRKLLFILNKFVNMWGRTVGKIQGRDLISNNFLWTYTDIYMGSDICEFTFEVPHEIAYCRCDRIHLHYIYIYLCIEMAFNSRLFEQKCLE